MAKIMIGIPTHSGSVSAAAQVSVAQASSRLHQVVFSCLGLSLLAKNFSLLFLQAIQQNADFFVLHHSDLGVVGTLGKHSGSWMDLLVDRLVDNGLSALSVVVPIKSEGGVTSSGLEMVKDDPWSLRRLTIKELERLPVDLINRADMCELFGVNEDKAGALLVNSGLLIMDVRDRGGVWREKKWPGFHIYDEIAWNTKGVGQSATVPEDWGFSAWCHDNSVLYGMTKELLITHIGVQNFTSWGAWGIFEHDEPRQQLHPRDYEKT